MDGSYHRWLGEAGLQFTLLLAVDDATGAVVNAVFCEHENSLNYFLLTQELVENYGAPVALYIDRHAVFKHTPGSGLAGAPTQFSRAMDELGIRMIFALSPQAKGRVERTAETFQGPAGDGTFDWLARPPSRKLTACCRASCRASTHASPFRRNALRPLTDHWRWMYAWTVSSASSTAGRSPGTTP